MAYEVDGDKMFEHSSGEMKCPACSHEIGSWPYIQSRGRMACSDNANDVGSWGVMQMNGENYYECFNCKAWFSESGKFVIPYRPYKPWGKFRIFIEKVRNLLSIPMPMCRGKDDRQGQQTPAR